MSHRANSQRTEADHPGDLADDLCELDRAAEHLQRVGLERQPHELHHRADVQPTSSVFQAPSGKRRWVGGWERRGGRGEWGGKRANKLKT